MRGAIISEIDQGSFEMTAPNSGGNLVYRFDWIAGSLFHRSFDPAALFSMLKIDTIEDERGSEMRARTLQGAASRVEFYGRCPA